MKSALLFLAFVACAVAGPLDRSQGPCSRQCTESHKFAYKPGTSYIYDYVTRSETTMQGTTDEKAALKLTCEVELTVLGSCDFAVQLRNVQLEEEDPQARGRSKNEDLQQALEKAPLRFSFQDGKIDSVCPSEDDSPRVLNIKKGILSTIQNSMENLETSQEIQEVDVAGTCPTVYTSLGRGWSSLEIRKSKDLSSCKDRESGQSALQATPLEKSSKSRPVVKGSQECTQSYRNDILNKVDCKETHVVRPFSRQENGAITTVQQSLNFRTQRSSRISSVPSSQPKELLFDHEYEEDDSGRSESNARDALQEMDAAVPDEVKSSAPGKFLQLVYSLKKLNFKSLQRLYKSADDKQKKFIEDALPAVGTSASVRLVTEAIKNNDISGASADMFLSSLAFITKPTPEMISQATMLINSGNIQAYLPVSTLCHSFCRSHPDCGSVPEVRDLVRTLFAKLGENCYASDDEYVTLMALKAIGNIGQADGREDVLQRCYKNPQLDIETRLAAITAFRRFTCDIPRNDLVRLFQDNKEDIELRIAAYLLSMKCPSASLIQTVKETLEDEPIKQVGSFVFSHLRAVLKHGTKFQRDIQAIVDNLAFMNQYQSDMRKFSKFTHVGYFVDVLETGYDMDISQVFTPDSYVPRSLTLNATVEAFGIPTNLFEIGLRAERIEQLINKALRKNTDNSLRSKRSIDDNRIEQMDNQFNIKSKYNKDPLLSAYLKLFGNEIAYGKFNPNSYDSYNILDALVKLADPKGMDFVKSAVFMDSSMTIPTGSGMPLKLLVQGTTTVGVKVGGKFQIRSGSEIDINGKFQPSGAVEISTFMTVDAQNSQPGVKMVATLSHSSIVDGVAQIQNGQEVKLQLNVPRDQMELLDVKSKIFLVRSRSEVEQRVSQDKQMKMQSCTGQSVDSAFGVKLCASAEFPISSRGKSTPMYPFSGPAEVKVTLQKTDPTLTSYVFNTKFSNENGVKSGFLTVNTPGSSVNRELTLQAEHNENAKTVSLKVQTPPKKASVEAKYNFESEQLKLDIDTRVDDESMVQIVSELKSDVSQGRKSSAKYSPFLEIRSKGSRIFLLNGQWSVSKGSKYSGNLNIEDLTEMPIEMSVNIDCGDRNKIKGETNIKSSFLEGALSGFVQTGDNFATKMTGEFSLMKGKKEKVDFNAKFRDLSASSLTKYSGVLSFQNTLHPSLNTEINLESQKTDGHIENSLQITTGDGRRNRGNHITIQQILRYAMTPNNMNAGATLKLKYPERKIDWELEMKHENTDKSLANRMNVMYAPNRQLTTDIQGSIEPEMKGDIQISYPGRNMRFSANADKVDDEYRGEILAQMQRGEQIQISGSFKEGKERRGYNPLAKLEIRMPERSPVIINVGAKSSRGSFGLTGNAEYGSMKYYLDGEYKSGSQDHVVRAKVQTPSEQYSANGKLSVQSGEVKATADIQLGDNLQLNAKASLSNTPQLKAISADASYKSNRDSPKRIALDAELREASNGYQGTFGLKSPVQNIRGSFSTSLQGKIKTGSLRMNTQAELEYQPRQKISMNINAEASSTSSRRLLKSDITLSSPMGDLALSLNHNDDGREWNNGIKLAMPNNKNYALDSEGLIQFDRRGQKVKATVKASCSSNQVMASFQHQLTSSDITEKIELSSGNKNKISAEISGSKRNGELSGSFELKTFLRGYEKFSGEFSGQQNNEEISGNFKLQTPFRGYEETSATLNHKMTWNSIDTKAELQYNQRKALGVELSGRHSSEPKSCEGSLKIETPIRGAETLMAKIAYNNDGSKINADAELSRNYEKITTGVIFQNKGSRRDSNVELKVYFTSPITNYENLEASLVHSGRLERFKTVLSARLPYEKSVSFQAQGQIKSMNSFDVSLTAQTPVRKYERIQLEISHNMQPSTVKSTAQISVGPKKVTIELNGNHISGYSSRDLSGNMLITTPFSGYEEIKAEVKHTWQQQTYNTRIEANKGSDSITFNHELTVHDLLNFDHSLEIKTPFSHMQRILLKNKSEKSPGRFSHESELEYSRNKRMTLSVQGSSRHSRSDASSELTIKMTSPFYTLSSLSVDASYRADAVSSNPQIQIQFNNDKKIRVEGTLSMERSKVNGRLAWISSFHNYENIVLEGKLDTSGRQKTAEISLKWDPRSNKQVAISGSSLIGYDNADIQLLVLTPVKNYEKVEFKTNYQSAGNSISGSAALEAGWRKIIFNGNGQKSRDGAAGEISLSTPFESMKEQKLSGEYSISSNRASGKLIAEYARQQASVETEIQRDSGRASAKVHIRTPIENYESVLLSLRSDLDAERKELSGLLEYGANKIEINSEFQLNSNGNGNVKVEFRSPFSGAEELIFEGDLQRNVQESRLTSSAQWAPNKQISVNAAMSNGASEVTINTPFKQYKQMKYNGELKSRSGATDLNVKFEVNHDKKASLNLYKQITSNSMEGKMEMTTPFENMNDIKISAKASNEGSQNMKGTLKINSPFELLKDVELSGEYRKIRNGHSASLKLDTSKSAYEISGEITQEGLRLVNGKLTINTPHPQLRNMEIILNLKSNGLQFVDGEFAVNSPRATHSITVQMKNDESKEGSIKIRCPWLESETVTLAYTLNDANANNMEGSLSLETSSETHKISGNYKNNGRSMDAEIRLESPKLRTGPASAKVSYSNRRNKDVKLSAQIGTSRSMHSINLQGEIERSKLSGKVSVNSEFIPGKALSAEGSTTFTDQEAEAELSIKTQQSTHSLSANYKYVHGSYNGQFTVDSPALSIKTLSASANYKISRDEAEGSLTIGTPSQQIKASGKVKASSGNAEASFRLDTPFRQWTTLSADASVNYENLRNIEASLNIQSSHPSMRELSAQGKLLANDGNDDLTINLRLPSREWSSIGIHFTDNMKPDFSAVAARLTIELPRAKYSTYADCKFNYPDYSILVGHELGSGRKIEATCTSKSSRESLNLQGSLTMPNHDQHEAKYEYTTQRNQVIVKATYKSPSQNTYSLDTSMNYYNPTNFNAELNLNTPISGLKSIYGKVRQQSSRYRLITSIEQSWTPGEKISFNFDHDRREQKGSVQLKTTYRSARNAILNYNINSDSAEAEFQFNENTIAKVSGSSVYQSGAKGYKRDFEIDVPALKMSIGGHYKPEESGYDMTLKCDTPKRNIQFHTSQQVSEKNFAHGCELKWGEGRGQLISYNIQTVDNKRRDLETKDVMVRVDFPLRAFEVKTTTTNKPNSCSMVYDIYWDVARDAQKHLVLSVQHDDLSSRSATAHKIQASLSHPSLSKDISVTCEGSLSSDEIYGKADVEYSNNPKHNMKIELKARDLAPGRRNTHYTLEVSALQPISNTNIRLSGELKNDRQQALAGLSVNYLNRNRQQQIHELKADLKKPEQELALSARSGANEATVIGKLFNRDLEYSASLEHMINNRSPTKSSLRLSKRHASMEFTYATPEDTGVMVKAAAPEDKMFMEVSHKSLGKTISDMLVKVGLREKRYIGSELKWRPEALDEVSNYISQSYSSASDEASSFLSMVAQETSNELRSKSQLMGSSLRQEIRPLMDDLSREMDQFNNDLQQASKRLNSMYYYDEFYMKTIMQNAQEVASATGRVIYSTAKIMGQVAQKTASAVKCVFANTFSGAVQVCEAIADGGRQALILTERILDVVMERIAGAFATVTEYAFEKVEVVLTNLIQKLIDICERYGPTVERYASSVKEVVDDSWDTISEYSAPLVEKLTRNQFCKYVVNYVKRVVATFEQFGMEAIQKNAKNAYVTVADSMADIYENVINHPNVQYMNDMATHLARKTRSIYRNLGMEDFLGNLAEAGKNHAQDMIKNQLRDVMEHYTQLRAGVHVDYRPQNGIITVQMRLPVQKDSLLDALDLTSYPEYQKLQELKDRYIDYSKDSVWDSYYKTKNYFSSDSLIPPFKARGLMAGDQHFITFDGTHFEFKGECSYLLARDFHNGDFSVIVNYAKDGQRVAKKSITVNSNGRKFDINNDYKVTLDGNKVELPQEIEGTTVRREGPSVIVENDNGLQVTCNLHYDQCVTEVSGQYFGKTGGLMGTYDYEPKLDLMTPGRQLVDDADSFASEWHVGQGRCTKENLAEPIVTDFRASDTCKKYFEVSDSIFRPCFKVVEPAAYLKMCLHDMATASYSEMEEKVCVSAAAYRDECQKSGVPLPMPRSCVRCEKPDGSEIFDGDVTRITEAGHTADVVFIVENKACNKNVAPGLGKLAQGIEDSFRAKGYSNMRYAVVGFGGDGVYEDAHVHTADGQIFASARSIDSAFSSLTYGNGESNVFDAIRYALNLPYRIGSVKVMVLAKCTMCQVEDVDADYTDIYRTLLDRDITLHVLDDREFSVKSAGSKAKKVFGVDKKYAYTVKDLRDNSLVGDTDLHSQIRLPRDFCVPLALELDGSLFTAKRMTEKRSINKKFIDVFSRRITKAQPSDCQVCECITSEDGVGQSICQRCVSPTFGSMLSPDFSESIYSSDSWQQDSSPVIETRRLKTRKLKLRRKQN